MDEDAIPGNVKKEPCTTCVGPRDSLSSPGAAMVNWEIPCLSGLLFHPE